LPNFGFTWFLEYGKVLEVVEIAKERKEYFPTMFHVCDMDTISKDLKKRAFEIGIQTCLFKAFVCDSYKSFSDNYKSKQIFMLNPS